MTSNLAEQETVKRRHADQSDLSTRPTRRIWPQAWRPIDEEETQILASISGITPLPVKTTDLMIDAEWFRVFHSWLDTKSRGKANSIISLLSFLVIGGSASVINLLVLLVFDVLDRAHHNDVVLQLVYGMIATEISIIYNFYLNDRFTFRAMIDHNRTWLQRCLRFHGPAAVGFTLTQILHTVFLVALRSRVAHASIIGQALSIAIVTVVNFMMHRFWTYRPRNPAPATA